MHSGTVASGLTSFLRSAADLREEAAGLWSPSSRASSEVRSAFGRDSHDACYQTEEGSFWFAHRNRCIVELVRRYPPSGVLLDVGGGNGYVTRGLRDAGFRAVVVEPGVGGARNALYRGLSPVVHATLDAAGFRPHSVPAIGLFDVLEHIADSGAFLRYAARLLQDDGKLYLTVPAYASLWSSEDVAAGHQRRYTRATLRRELEDNGFSIDFDSYVFVPLPLAIALFRALPERLGRVRAAHAATSEHAVGSPAIRTLSLAALSLEPLLLRHGVSMPAGASVIVAARKREAMA